MSDDLINLRGLARRINEEHRQCGEALAAGMKHAMRAGDLLIEAKADVPHGQWQDWVRANCEFSLRTAQAYMRVARNRDELTSEAQRVTHLPLRGALAMLAKPKGESHELVDEANELMAQFDDFMPHFRQTITLLRLALDGASNPEEAFTVAHTARELANEAAEYNLRIQRMRGKLLTDLGTMLGIDDIAEVAALVQSEGLMQAVEELA